MELADLTEGADEWEEWESMASHSTSLAPGLDVTTQLSKRTEKEEKFLWAMLKEIDQEMAREEKKVKSKEGKSDI